MTRTFALALVAALGTASVASADSFFGIIDGHDNGSTVELGTVTAASGGVVEIYEAGRLIGSKPLHAGANANVRVNVGSQPDRDLTARIVLDGQVLDTARINVN